MAPEDLTPDDLVQIEAIKQVKYRYLRCLDQKLWDELAGVLAPHCVAAYSGGKYSYEGREAIIDFLRRSMGAPTFHSSHRCHHPEISLTSGAGGTTATGVWALDDVVVMTDFDLTVRGAAFYEDEYDKTSGRWMISRTGYKRTYEEIQPRGNVEGLKLTASWWSTGGQSELPAG
ncbi:MAG: nuclear transport factor 2 family protein [Actinobacteria bacterium]|nr:nuclear transport factor 2 family protein [Actinomycetota bacterium]